MSQIAQKPRRRKYSTRACDACKQRKRRCTGTQPCSPCLKTGNDCAYLARYTRGHCRPPPTNQPAQPEAVHHSQKSRKKFRKGHISTGDPGIAESSPEILALDPHKEPDVPHPSFDEDIASDLIANPHSGRHNTAPSQSSNAWTSAYLEPRSQSPDLDGTEFAGQNIGPTSPALWLQNVWRRVYQVERNLPNNAENESRRDDSSSIFTYGDKIPLVFDHNADFPTRSRAQKLLDRYFDFASPTYKHLHRPTIQLYLNQLHESLVPPGSFVAIPKIHQAVVTMVLAHGSIYMPITEHIAGEGEYLFHHGQCLIESEKGAPCLESVQARLVACHYLLSSSRPNQAWFLFGTVVQLTLALGLHQRRSVGTRASPVTIECRKRVFWAVFCSDKFISIALGRPTLLYDEYASQDLPSPINDEDVGTSHYDSDLMEETDCVMVAPVFQARLALIISKALREEHNMMRESDTSKLEMAFKLNADLEDWHATLPPMFSGAIKPTSLAPVFRRQADALNSFYLFAVLHINTPLLLTLFSQSQSAASQDQRFEQYTQNCIAAARSIAQAVGNFAREKQKVESYWFTQYSAFKALSIIYVHLIQAKGFRGYLLEVEKSLLNVAERCHAYLADASKSNSPSLRYGVILEELRSEVRRILNQAADSHHLRLQEGLDSPRSPSEPAQSVEFGDFYRQVDINPSYPESVGFPDWNLDVWSQINALSLHFFDDSSFETGVEYRDVSAA